MDELGESLLSAVNYKLRAVKKSAFTGFVNYYYL